MRPTTSSADVITLNIPFRMAKRGGRKAMQLPACAPAQPNADSTLVRALARAFRWSRMLESGEFATIAGYTLVSTGEPGAICTRTLYWAYIGRLVCGFDDVKRLALVRPPAHGRCG